MTHNQYFVIGFMGILTLHRLPYLIWNLFSLSPIKLFEVFVLNRLFIWISILCIMTLYREQTQKKINTHFVHAYFQVENDILVRLSKLASRFLKLLQNISNTLQPFWPINVYNATLSSCLKDKGETNPWFKNPSEKNEDNTYVYVASACDVVVLSNILYPMGNK